MIDNYHKLRKIAYPPDKREYGRKLIFSIFCRSVSTILAIFFKKLNFTPNAVSLISIGSSCLGIYLLYNGNLITGALLSANSKLLDCVDGELARITDRVTKIGKWLEPLNSNIQYLFVLPALSFHLLRQEEITVSTVFISFIASGLFVVLRGIYNTDTSNVHADSILKKVILCQFKKNHDLRRENAVGAFFYYLRYNLITQNGIMYPMLILLSLPTPSMTFFYVVYFILAYLIFSFVTILGILWFGQKVFNTNQTE
jgi:phosphatidylglycerophosphate synthase